MQSLQLDPDTWDLMADASGNIAVCSAPLSALQDVACAVRTFTGDCYYNTARGLPYFGLILGRQQSASVFSAQAAAAAEAVTGVSSAKCALDALPASRKLSGTIQVAMTDGTTGTVTF